MKDKEQAKFDYLKMIGQSWTWTKLTAEEKAKFLEILEHPCSGPRNRRALRRGLLPQGPFRRFPRTRPRRSFRRPCKGTAC